MPAKVFSFPLIDGIGFDGKLHFAKVDDLISAINDEVYLRFLGAVVAEPSGRLGLDAGNAERIFDLWEMTEANLLEGITTPAIIGLSGNDYMPGAGATSPGVFYELQVE